MIEGGERMKTRTTEFDFTPYEQMILRDMLEDRIDSAKETLDLFKRKGDYHFMATFEDAISDYENILTELNKYGSL